jgi:Protein of unknown function (DUF835)
LEAALLHVHKGGSSISLTLKRGLGYLALDPEVIVPSFLRSLASPQTRFLWMASDRYPDAPEGGEVLRVTTLHRGPGTADPRRLQDLRAAATTFFDEGPGLLVIDCLPPLILHAGVERVLRFVDDIHEEVAMRDAYLVVFANPRELNRRMIAWLERELDPLPSAVEPPPAEAGRLAA